MDKKRLVSVKGLVLVVIMVAFLANSQPVSAQECRIIRLQGMELHKSVAVEPETLMVAKGTCVIWFNRAAANEIKIVFEDGKKCASVSDAPVGFSLDHNECYVTSWIPFGGTSSLRFQEEGTYNYGIEMPAGEVGEKGRELAKGSIIVR